MLQGARDQHRNVVEQKVGLAPYSPTSAKKTLEDPAVAREARADVNAATALERPSHIVSDLRPPMGEPFARLAHRRRTTRKGRGGNYRAP